MTKRTRKYLEKRRVKPDFKSKFQVYFDPIHFSSINDAKAYISRNMIYQKLELPQ